MLNIPKKTRSGNSKVLINHQVRLNEEKTRKLARVREILGGYSNNELLEILVDYAINEYDDGQEANEKFLPKELKGTDSSDEESA